EWILYGSWFATVCCHCLFFFFQAEDGIRDWSVTGVQTCALPILMLRFQSARDLLPAQPAKAIEALDGALDRADQAITEGRDAIQNLRSSTVVSNELAQAITTLAEELSNGNGRKDCAIFRMSVEGAPRDLHPIVRDDIHRIAREALRNAFHHAQADRIEAEVTYGARELRVRIRDDGKGIDPQQLSGGRAEHWGLAGMR